MKIRLNGGFNSGREEGSLKRTKEAAFETREGILDAAERPVYRTWRLTNFLRAHCTRGGRHAWRRVLAFRKQSRTVQRDDGSRTLAAGKFLQHIVETATTIEDLERHCISSFVELQGNSRLRRVYAVLLLKCEFTADMQSLIERERAIKEGITSALTRLFTRLQKTGRLHPVLRPRLLALGVYAFMLGLFTDYLRSPERYSMPGDAQRLIRYFFAPLESESSRSRRTS